MREISSATPDDLTVQYGPRAPRPTLLDPYKETIDARLSDYPQLTAVRLFREIREAGYPGAYGQVKRYVRLKKDEIAERQREPRAGGGSSSASRAHRGRLPRCPPPHPASPSGMRYPMPCSLKMYVGSSASSPSFLRSRLTADRTRPPRRTRRDP